MESVATYLPGLDHIKKFVKLEVTLDLWVTKSVDFPAACSYVRCRIHGVVGLQSLFPE
jgi:hypothetical protein